MSQMPEHVREKIAQRRQRKLWHADPHKYGSGKVHIIDLDNDAKTYCGQYLKACPGGFTTREANCKNCLNNEVRRQVQAVRDQEHEDRVRELNEERELRRQERRDQYHRYLQTPEWKKKSSLVLKRANYICEGCGVQRATQAHHITYAHVFEEFLWELRAVCRDCHERVHDAEFN